MVLLPAKECFGDNQTDASELRMPGGSTPNRSCSVGLYHLPEQVRRDLPGVRKLSISGIFRLKRVG
jgi:hypothetical protein